MEFDSVIMLVMALPVIICATYLAASDIAPWEDVYRATQNLLTILEETNVIMVGEKTAEYIEEVKEAENKEEERGSSLLSDLQKKHSRERSFHPRRFGT